MRLNAIVNVVFSTHSALPTFERLRKLCSLQINTEFAYPTYSGESHQVDVSSQCARSRTQSSITLTGPTHSKPNGSPRLFCQILAGNPPVLDYVSKQKKIQRVGSTPIDPICSRSGSDFVLRRPGTGVSRYHNTLFALSMISQSHRLDLFFCRYCLHIFRIYHFTSKWTLSTSNPTLISKFDVSAIQLNIFQMKTTFFRVALEPLREEPTDF